MQQKKLSGLKESFKKNSSNIESIFNDPNYVNTFKDIKEELGRKSESKSKDFIDQMIDYFSIKSPTSINDLKMIINSKKYEMIVKSIKYFFDNISGKKLILPGNIILSEMDLKKLKITLEDLKRKNIEGWTSFKVMRTTNKGNLYFSTEKSENIINDENSDSDSEQNIIREVSNLLFKKKL